MSRVFTRGLLVLLLTGCATTFRHPSTGHTITCPSAALSWGAVAMDFLALIVQPSAIGGTGWAGVDCLETAQRAGYVEVP